MTVNKLLKLLQSAADRGLGRCPVCIDKPTFTHPLESDGAIILDVSGVRDESVQMLNDDGGITHGPRDTERYRYSIILHGADYTKPRRARKEARDAE